LTQLRSLDVESNELTGGVPTEFRQLQRLRSLKVRYNRLENDDMKVLKATQAWCVEKLHPKCEVYVRDPSPERK
jgi:hypothetical protein